MGNDKGIVKEIVKEMVVKQRKGPGQAYFDSFMHKGIKLYKVLLS